MNPAIEKILCAEMNVSVATFVESIQELWSGYGEILRYQLENQRPVVVKWIRFPDEQSHPRGWVSNLSHQRKVKSYEIEKRFYKTFASQCDENSRVAKCFAQGQLASGEHYLILEDLDASGYPVRKHALQQSELEACLKWLANFHAQFLNIQEHKLWQVGTYWHLDTRPDELAVLTDKELKRSAAKIDEVLNTCPIVSLVHGDAKVANFCFSSDGQSVAGVDFQYVGGGCGMKDVAYFLGSCLDEHECEKREEELLDVYFAFLYEAILKNENKNEFEEIEELWRPLYRVAWADFHRFLKGWSPGHWKINSYSERIVREVCTSLK